VGSAAVDNGADLFGMNPFLSQEEKKEMIQKILDQACILDTKKVRIFSGFKPDVGNYPLPQEESELIKYALDVASLKGVQLMLENEPVCYISKLEDYIKMFSSGEYVGLRAWFDVANVYEEGQRISSADLKALSPYIDYLHVKDPEGFKLHKYKPLGQGYIN